MWKRIAALALLGALFASSLTLVSAQPPYLNIETGPYHAGQPLTIRVIVVNPEPHWANYSWNNGCTTEGRIESERRLIASWTYGPTPICTQQLVGLSVPPNSSELFHRWTIDTLSDDGCIRIAVNLRGYPVFGSTETCPVPVEPEPEAMTCVSMVPAAVMSGEPFTATAIVRGPDREALEGVRVVAQLGDVELGALLTGPDGRAVFSGRGPDVGEVTTVWLVFYLSAPGFVDASRSSPILVSPPASRHLVIRTTYATGDVLRGDGFAILDVAFRTNDDEPATDVTLSVETEGPLRVTDQVALGGGRFALTVRGDPVAETRVGIVRVLASAPGLRSTGASVDFVVIPKTAPLPAVAGAPDGAPPAISSFAASAAGFSLGLVASLWVWRRSRRRTGP